MNLFVRSFYFSVRTEKGEVMKLPSSIEVKVRVVVTNCKNILNLVLAPPLPSGHCWHGQQTLCTGSMSDLPT